MKKFFHFKTSISHMIIQCQKGLLNIRSFPRFDVWKRFFLKENRENELRSERISTANKENIKLTIEHESSQTCQHLDLRFSVSDISNRLYLHEVSKLGVVRMGTLGVLFHQNITGSLIVILMKSTMHNG